jgi:hypothetical protein
MLHVWLHTEMFKSKAALMSFLPKAFGIGNLSAKPGRIAEISSYY